MTAPHHRYTAVPSPEVEALLDRTLPEIAAGIGALHLSKLRAVVLGGGYGRGEGGVRHTPEGDRLYNDLDFFVFSDGADRAEAREIDRALKPLSEAWEKKLGVAADFGPVKELGALKNVASTLMFQELRRGWLPVWGDAELEKHLAALAAEELPFSEAARLLLNRGMGLLWAGELLLAGSSDADFIVRNMNKALLGAGDALLIAAGCYRWRGGERVEEFAEYVRRESLPAEYADLYEGAFRYKLEPDPVLPPEPEKRWLQCRGLFLAAVRQVAGVPESASVAAVAAGLSRRAARERSWKNCLRWARRTGRVRLPHGAFDPPVVTVLGRLYACLARSAGMTEVPPELRRLWTYFN